ncbi:hypothetical protein EV363DRAFT_52907 [Boletus edulis]|nr:hypothetical protein EV363DRAFT_52907 [Boletus edulis]
MVFKLFMTLDELFNLLVEHCWIQPHPNPNSHVLEDWRCHKQNFREGLGRQRGSWNPRSDGTVSIKEHRFQNCHHETIIDCHRSSGSIGKVTPRSTIQLLDIDSLELARTIIDLLNAYRVKQSWTEYHDGVIRRASRTNLVVKLLSRSNLSPLLMSVFQPRAVHLRSIMVSGYIQNFSLRWLIADRIEFLSDSSPQTFLGASQQDMCCS